MADRQFGGLWRRWVPRLAMLAGVLAWLWPIGPLGPMPVGGDATQFSMGLMAYLRASIRAGRLPIWNDLWGFGFPGLAESQMGVYYPPHLILYGLLPTEVAAATSLVLHTLWGALGASWAAQRFGASEVGAALAGFAWSTCGFFLIHQPHHWGYTAGSWMPWAWGLAWQATRGEGLQRTPWLLSGVLALQVLPGHFQLAFITEVGVLGLAMAGGGRSIARRLGVVLAVVGMVPLAAMQLWPTARLADLSNARRDFEYLSGFAASPVHFVSYVAPGLFHRSPLWRAVAWDPFHTSPEELLGYVGVVPLFLAIGAIARGWRGDPAVRALAIVAALTLFFSLGPYAPGFGWLIRLPGFSFFRAPARWGLGTNLALAILAAKGFDGLAGWPEAGRFLRRSSFASLVAVLAVVLVVELALASSRGGGWKAVASGFDRALQVLPWSDRAESKRFRAVMAEAYKPHDDLRTLGELARLDGKGPPPIGPTLASDRLAIYGRELSEAGAVLAAVALATALIGRPRAFAGALLAVALADALLLARHRPFDLGSIHLTDLGRQPVLSRLAKEPRGTRVLDPAQNLFMLAGVAPVGAYRTLDLPSPKALLQVACGPSGDARTFEALRAAGVAIRLLDPLEARGLSRKDLDAWAPGGETIRDPRLAAWLFGKDFAAWRGLQDFQLLRLRSEASRAWLVSSAGLVEADGMADPLGLLDHLRDAKPLTYRSDVPERAEVDASVMDQAPTMVVLSTTFDPEWQAWWSSPASERRPAEVVKVLGGWQGVASPGPGRWTLHLVYSGRSAWVGLGVSLVAWVVWGWGCWRVGAKRGRADREDRRGDRGGVGVRLAGTDPHPAQPPRGRGGDGNLAVGRGPQRRRPAPEPSGAD